MSLRTKMHPKQTRIFRGWNGYSGSEREIGEPDSNPGSLPYIRLHASNLWKDMNPSLLVPPRYGLNSKNWIWENYYLHKIVHAIITKRNYSYNSENLLALIQLSAIRDKLLDHDWLGRQFSRCSLVFLSAVDWSPTNAIGPSVSCYWTHKWRRRNGFIPFPGVFTLK